MKKVIALFLFVLFSLNCFVGCASGDKKENKTLTYGIGADVDNFDPFTNQMTIFINTLNFNCYETLFHFDENMEYAMDLATSYEQVDETTYVFHLRKDVKFHNGESFTADDVIYTINTIKDESTGAWRNSQYANVSKMTAKDSHTLEIKLASPQPAFLDNLAYTAIVSKSTTPAQLKTKPIGTGAFKFVSWTPNDNITLEKYSEYWDAENVALEKLIFKVIPDSTVALTNLKSGAIQYLGIIDAETAKTVQNTDGLKVYQSKYANTVYELELGRHNHEALADPDVVKAMFMAFDRNTVASSVFAGFGKASKSPFPSAASYYTEADTVGFDLDGARALLATTDYASGFEFDVYVLTGDSQSQQAMIIWQDSLKELGITMNIKTSEMSVWLDAYLTRSYDMIANSYSMVGTDPATYCSVLLAALKDYQTADLGELNTLVESGATTSDAEAREEIYQSIQEILVNYRPVTSYVECPSLNGAAEDLNGIVVNGMGHTILKYAKFGD